MFSTLNTFTVYVFFLGPMLKGMYAVMRMHWICTQLLHFDISLVASFQQCILANTLLTKTTTDP